MQQIGQIGRNKVLSVVTGLKIHSIESTFPYDDLHDTGIYKDKGGGIIIVASTNGADRQYCFEMWDGKIRTRLKPAGGSWGSWTYIAGV